MSPQVRASLHISVSQTSQILQKIMSCIQSLNDWSSAVQKHVVTVHVYVLGDSVSTLNVLKQQFILVLMQRMMILI